MNYLMHIGFDNSARLLRNVYYFEYKGIRFKLFQNNMRKWRDVLLTIAPDYEESINKTYLVASEFLTALSWENDSRVKFMPIGGISVPDNFQLRQAKCTCYALPKIPFHIVTRGYDI